MAVNSLELEVLTENIYLIKGRLTHVEIGRVVILLFMSRMVPDELYQSISNHFVQIAPWKHFIEPLNENMESGSGHISLVSSKPQAALKCTFNINWKEKVGCISPHCYVYIAERLLFLVSSCQGYFFTTRSSCAERLRFQEANLVTCLVNDAIGHNSLIEAFDSVVEMVKNAMLNRNETLGWIRRSKINAADHFPLLVLRLMFMISLAYLNTGRNFGLLANRMTRTDIISELTPAFCKKLWTAGKPNFLNIIAEALQMIENPLVVVDSEMNSANFLHPNALLIKTKVIRCGEDIQVETKNKCDLQMCYGQFWEAFDVLQEKEHGEYSIGTFSSNVPHIKLELQNAIHVLLSGITCLKSMLVGMQKLFVALDMRCLIAYEE
ncbi:uncharacterized protein LOC143857462 [Tasmannia lanceolata]|uniref:uncharacterized protein LOC143857462 n=1 Tax=Tasmannia lanceolata TaxID=3420 RepID=UPI004063E331